MIVNQNHPKRLERVASVLKAISILRLDLVLYERKRRAMPLVVGTHTRVMVRIVSQEVAEDLKVVVRLVQTHQTQTQAGFVCVLEMVPVMV